MTVGDLRVAIRRMLRVPHPRTRTRRWIAIGVAAALVFGIQLIAGWDWFLFALVAGIGFGVIATFTLVGRMWGWIALAVGLGFGLGAIPLFGVLGLELSLAVALFASLMSADVGAALARTLSRMPATGLARAKYPGRTLAGGAIASAAIAVAITLVPGVIAAVRGIAVPTCDWEFGISSFIAMPLASAVLGGAIGHAMGALVGPRRVLGAIMAQLPAIVVALTATWRFYAAPPVYTYNAVLGYFPGNMYDENVRFTPALAWSRLEQLLWVVAVIALVAHRFDVASYRARLRAPRPAGRRIGSLGIALAAAALAFALRWHGGDLGFAVDAEHLQVALGGRIETPHFIIHYSRTPEIEAEIELIAADHEFRYHQVVSQLGVEPPDKLVSFYFADRDEKYRLHGSRDVEMAKPWRGEIYLEHRAFPHSSLRHEIAHAVAAEFGDPLWGVSTRPILGIPMLVSPGLVEGLAVAVDWPSGYERPNPHELVRVIQALGKQPSIDQLLGLSFFSMSSAQGYTTAGSFLRFLLDRYGAAKVRELYRTGGDFHAAYGLPLEHLEREWREMLATITIPADMVEAQKERFRAGSVFSKTCPHAIAKQRDRAHRAFGEGERERAIELMRDVCVDSSGEPRYRNELAAILYSGEGRDRGEALVLWSAVAFDETRITTSLRMQALERLAKAAAIRGDLPHARKVLAYAGTLAVDLDQRRQVEAMTFALDHTGPAAPALRAYFFPTRDVTKDGPPVDPLADASAAVTAEPTLGFAHYLLGLQRHNRGEHAAALPSLEAALNRGLPGLSFVKNAARRLAVSAYRTHDYNRLAQATMVLTSSSMTSGDALLAKDWQDRAAFETRAR